MLEVINLIRVMRCKTHTVRLHSCGYGTLGIVLNLAGLGLFKSFRYTKVGIRDFAK